MALLNAAICKLHTNSHVDCFFGHSRKKRPANVFESLIKIAICSLWELRRLALLLDHSRSPTAPMFASEFLNATSFAWPMVIARSKTYPKSQLPWCSQQFQSNSLQECY